MDNPYTKDLAKMRNKIEGDMGETRAVQFLRGKGYRILQTNYKTKFGEIDIIAQDGKVIVFVEVKERATLAYGRPIEAVNFQKQQKIRRVAEFYLMMKHSPYADCRFDVIEILGDSINHETNAF